MSGDKVKGFEYLDDTPVAVPVQFRQRPGEVDRLRDMMRTLIVDLRDSKHVESFEESLDFEVDDDDDPLSSVVSQSETRYMKEEKLLTEAQEAEKIRLQRRAADEWRKRNENRSEREADRNGDARSGNVDHKRGAEREQEGRSGEAARGGAGSSKGGGAAEGGVAKAGDERRS